MLICLSLLWAVRSLYLKQITMVVMTRLSIRVEGILSRIAPKLKMSNKSFLRISETDLFTKDSIADKF
jgi:hypothetical protein